jgi:hypothetical protein
MAAPENGNGFTQKEMLVRIDGKLDAALARITAIETKLAVHEAKPLHDPSTLEHMEQRVDHVESGITGIKRRQAYSVGALAVLIVVGDAILRGIVA